jgi:D-sedoheptulose 7-phosphate isomerase
MINKFINNYKSSLVEAINNLDNHIIEKVIKVIDKSEMDKSTIYIIGNGGSAATASHMVNDLGVGLKRRGIKNLKVKSLADNTPVCTAIANDIGYENIFYMQLKDVLEKEDVLIAISCSGNSPNIIKATTYAKEIGSTIIGLSGFDGGELKNLSDINFHVEAKSGDYGLVEDIHMILDHMIYSYYINTEKR